MLNTIATAQYETLACAPAVFASLTDTVHPQGIAALFPAPDLPLSPVRTLTLMLDGIRDPGNAGTLLRSAEAAGAELAIFGPGSVDPFNEKVLRAAMGAHFRLPIRACPTWAQVLPLLQDGVASYVADTAGALDYDQVDWRKPSLLAVGSESVGAGAEMRALAVAITIPMAGKTESLNAGVAGSIILFEAARQRRNPR
ncbi:MAG: RNA methyltransferase [Anaerolineales bacterium]|nr:RNA methyltransferase [Anaerolineales bacterium]